MGFDWGIVDTQRAFREDTVYIMTTDDGADIWVRARGVRGNVTHFFETGSAKYYWLNDVVAYATGGRTSNATWNGVHLDVWQVCLVIVLYSLSKLSKETDLEITRLAS